MFGLDRWALVAALVVLSGACGASSSAARAPVEDVGDPGAMPSGGGDSSSEAPGADPGEDGEGAAESGDDVSESDDDGGDMFDGDDGDYEGDDDDDETED